MFSEPKSTFSEGVLLEGGPTDGGPSGTPANDLHGGLRGGLSRKRQKRWKTPGKIVEGRGGWTPFRWTPLDVRHM